MKYLKWGAAGLLLLLIGGFIGAALGGEDPGGSTGAAVRREATATPESTATPTPTPKPKTAVKRKKQSRPATMTKPAPPPKPKPPAFVACDPNIRAKVGTTTCAFAQNVFYEYWYSWNYAELSAFAATALPRIGGSTCDARAPGRSAAQHRTAARFASR